MISTAPPPAAPASTTAPPLLPALDGHAADHGDPLFAHRTRRNR